MKNRSTCRVLSVSRFVVTRVSVSLLLFALALCPLRAMQDYANGILDVQEVIKQAATVTPRKYPNADEVLVDDFIAVEYRPDGQSVTWDDTFLKILTEKGKRNNKTLTRHFTLPYGESSFKLVQVIKPDGTVVPIDIEAQGGTMIDRSQMGSNIYNPNRKVVRVVIPNLEIGDMIRYVALAELVKPRVPNTWSDYQTLEYTSPIKHYVYRVKAPRELPLINVALKDELEGTVAAKRTEEGDHVVYQWEIADVPRMYTEPGMPSLHTVVQRLLVSTIKDWEDISKWYWELSEPHFESSPAMKQKVEELTAGMTDREEKIRAIFRFVSQEIRYMGITVEKEAPGYEPHDVQLTFENRHGVCRDKAALLVAMLRLAGFKAFPVLIHNGPKKDEEVPQPFFNHAISAVENPDGTYMLMDSTDENTAELFPAYLCNQSYLVARPEGETLHTSPIIPAEENMMLIETEAEIDAGGNLEGSSLLRFRGINDNAYRGYFSRINPEDRRRFFEGALKRFVPGTELTGLEIKPGDMQDTGTELEVALKFRADDVLVSGDNAVMPPVPSLGTRIGMANFVLGKTGLKKRKYPLKTDIACGVRETLRLKLYAELGKVDSLPEYPVLDSDTLLWNRQLKMSGDCLTGVGEFKMKAVEFSPEQYLELKEALRTIEINSRKRPILKSLDSVPTSESGQADVLILEEFKEYDLQDSCNWTTTVTVKEKILTYKGKKDSSEKKWNYNPVWEEIELLEATVTTGTKVQAISEQEINVMDAGWVASAPRYPAGKTFVASFPGVEIGSTIEYTVKHTYKDHPFFAEMESFRYQNPIKSKTVRILTPPDLSLRSLKSDGGFPVEFCPDSPPVIRQDIFSEEDKVVYEWTVVDQKQVKREDGLPPWWSFNPSIIASAGEWEAYAGRVRKALLEAARNQPESWKLGQELAAEGDEYVDKIAEIRDYVARNIRKAGPGLTGLPLNSLTPADKTLSEGYGNSADCAVLIYAMLSGAGIEPDFVLVSGSSQEPELRRFLAQWPNPYIMPTVLVRAPGKHPTGLLGKIRGTLVPVGSTPEYVYLNDTDQYAVLGATPHDGKLGLDLDTGKTFVVTPPERLLNRTRMHYRIELEPDGDAAIGFTRTYYGTRYGGVNRKFSEIPPEERRRYYLEVLAGLSQTAEATGELITDFSEYPGKESFSAEVDRFAVKDGEYFYFNLPRSLGNLLGLRADTRTNDLYWREPRNIEIISEILLPPGFRNIEIAPEELSWEAPDNGGTVSVEVTVDESQQQDKSQSVMSVKHSAKLNPAVIPPDQYEELLEINRRLSHSRARTILLRGWP